MSYEINKKLLDRNSKKQFVNSAIALQQIDQENDFLAREIAYEENVKYNEIVAGQKKQIKFLNENLCKLEKNYEKLDELYEIKNRELKENKEALLKSEKYNKKMWIATIISVGVSVASLLFTKIFSILV